MASIWFPFKHDTGLFHIRFCPLKNLNLRFRGSSNQRLIDVPASLKTGAVVLWDERQ